MADRLAAFVSRRVFVRGLGRLTAGAALLRWTACNTTAQSSGTDAAPSGAHAPGACLPFLTPIDGFYRQFGGRTTVDGWSLPDLDASSFELTLTGLVASEQRLRLADFEADEKHHVSVLKTMICVLGFHSTAIWTGVPLRLLLDRAGIDRERTVRLRFFGADGFDNNLRLDDVYDSPDDLFEPLIAFRIYGEPLPRELGFPFRLLLGDRYGYKNTKWLARIEASDRDEETGQYQARGYPDAGVIEPIPTVENLRLTETVPRGPVELCGFALSGYAGIERVELSVDGKPFERAMLSSVGALTERYPELAASVQLGDPERFGFPPRGVWAAWRFVLETRGGVQKVRVRVLDRAGNSAEGTELHITS